MRTPSTRPQPTLHPAPESRNWTPCLLICKCNHFRVEAPDSFWYRIKQEQAKKCWQTWPLGTLQDLQTKIAGSHWPHSQVGQGRVPDRPTLPACLTSVYPQWPAELEVLSGWHFPPFTVRPTGPQVGFRHRITKISGSANQTSQYLRLKDIQGC